MVELSLRETARQHGVSPGGLSKAVHAGREIKGMALHRYATIEEGKIAGFQFPEWYELPEESENEGEARRADLDGGKRKNTPVSDTQTADPERFSTPAVGIAAFVSLGSLFGLGR